MSDSKIINFLEYKKRICTFCNVEIKSNESFERYIHAELYFHKDSEVCIKNRKIKRE